MVELDVDDAVLAIDDGARLDVLLFVEDEDEVATIELVDDELATIEELLRVDDEEELARVEDEEELAVTEEELLRAEEDDTIVDELKSETAPATLKPAFVVPSYTNAPDAALG